MKYVYVVLRAQLCTERNSSVWYCVLPRIAYNVFNMDRKLRFIAKLPLIIGVFFSWDKNYWSYDVALWL